MLMENSDEPYAEEIARTVMGEIKRGREELPPPAGYMRW